MKALYGFFCLAATVAVLSFAAGLAARGIYEAILLGWGLFG